MNLRMHARTMIVYLLTCGLVIGKTLSFGAEPAPPEETPAMITLKEFIGQVVKRNENILAQQLEFIISTETVKGEKATFEPKMLTSYERGGQKSKYSRDERSSLFLFGSELNEVNETYNSSIESKVPTGATVKVGYNIKASRDLALDEEDQYKSFLGVELSQPLLKGSGIAATASIDVAEADSDITFQEYRQKILQIVLNASAACWDYYGARERLTIRRDSVKITEQILKDNRERARLGKMPEIEVFEAEAGLAKRISQELRAKQDLIMAMNNMQAYISSSPGEARIDIDFTGHLDSGEVKPDLQSSLQKASLYRPEYLSARKNIEKQTIIVNYAKNQRWPQLDLRGSYGLNGLGDTIGLSWDDMSDGDYRTWTVGAVLEIPLMGGMKTRSDLDSAVYRQRQALLEVRSVEVEMANMTDTAIQNVYSTREQLQNHTKVKGLYHRLLEVELAMLDAGRSNSRSVLDKEEDLIEAREEELESFLENKKAILALEAAEGTLMMNYGVEVMEMKKDETFRPTGRPKGP